MLDLLEQNAAPLSQLRQTLNMEGFDFVNIGGGELKGRKINNVKLINFFKATFLLLIHSFSYFIIP